MSFYDRLAPRSKATYTRPMTKRRSGFRPITSTVNIFLVLSLAAGVGLILVTATYSLLRSRDRLTRSYLLQQGTILYTSIANFMLPGDAPLAVKFMDQVALASPEASISLYRRDGQAAFSDNGTINRVNQNLGKVKFQPRAALVPHEPRPPAPRFKEASSSPPQEVFFRETEGGHTYFRVYRPLINLPKCSGCHGSDHTVRGVLDIRTDVTPFIRDQTLTLILGALGFFLVVGFLAVLIGSFLRRLVLSPISAIGRLCSAVTSGSFEGRVEVEAKNEIGDLARTVNQMVGGLRERFELTKYVSQGTIGALSEGQRPRRVQRCLLFTDVRGFTSFTESRDPEQVVEALNRLLEKQAEIIHEWGGDIDKFVGDEVVAVFSGEGASGRALHAGRDIVRLCAQRSEDFEGLMVGVGAAAGPVIQGMIGSERRADFTVIGDSVNVAARLCSAAKACQVLVSDSAKDEAGPGFEYTGPFKAKLKGKAAAQRVWVLVTEDGKAGEAR